MDRNSAHEITVLIDRWQQGDREAERALFEALYGSLRSMAAQRLAGEKDARSLTPTALLHEAYLRLARSKELNIKDRKHFLALVSRVMRQIIVDHARSIQSERRGTRPQQVDLLEGMAFTNSMIDEILTVDVALQRLAVHNPREASLVELRFFAGFSLEEAASALGVAERTARRDWESARVYLKEAIDGLNSADATNG